MASSDYQPPDLASVLRTLAQFIPPASQSLSPEEHSPLHPTSNARDQDASKTLETTKSSNNFLPTEAPSAKTVPPSVGNPSIDPATILDWSSGVRCVMRTVARNDASIMRIRKIIQIQRDHETQWWKGRQALRLKLSARVQDREKLNSVLRSLGGQTPSGSSTPVDSIAQEMEKYDSKVYEACREMVKAMATELQTLGVPFFGMPDRLIRRCQDGVPSGKRKLEDDDDGIDEQELIRLQRKMVELLEVMCKEEGKAV